MFSYRNIKPARSDNEKALLKHKVCNDFYIWKRL